VDWMAASFTWMIGFQLHEYDLQGLKLHKTRLWSPIKDKEQSNKGVGSKASPMSTTLKHTLYTSTNGQD